MMENCAEVTYPIPEEFSLGLMLTGKSFSLILYEFLPLTAWYDVWMSVGSNILGFFFIFTLQVNNHTNDLGTTLS